MHGSTLIIDVHLSITASMNVSPASTYTGSIPKRLDITGALGQVPYRPEFKHQLMFPDVTV